MTGALISGGSAGLGYGIVGKLIGCKLDDFINPNWKNYIWSGIGMGISKPLPLNPLPAVIGGVINSAITETSTSTDQVGKKVNEINGGTK